MQKLDLTFPWPALTKGAIDLFILVLLFVPFLLGGCDPGDSEDGSGNEFNFGDNGVANVDSRIEDSVFNSNNGMTGGREPIVLGDNETTVWKPVSEIDPNLVVVTPGRDAFTSEGGLRDAGFLDDGRRIFRADKPGASFTPGVRLLVVDNSNQTLTFNIGSDPGERHEFTWGDAVENQR